MAYERSGASLNADLLRVLILPSAKVELQLSFLKGVFLVSRHKAGWYFRLSSFFKERFGDRVYKIPVHAGFTCPNRDGSISQKGCVFCYNPGFSPPAYEERSSGKGLTVKEQVRHYQIKLEKVNVKRAPGKTDKKDNYYKNERDGASSSFDVPQKKYLAYFQSYSNTYAPLTKLQDLYEEALSLPGIIGLSIATRPDCLNEKTINLLEGYAKNRHIWLELGLQSAHDQTLNLINRGHTFEQFAEATHKVAGRGINVCAHIINGLPGEDRSHMLKTAVLLNNLPVQGIKFHQLQVVKNTLLENWYNEKKISLLSREEYLEIVCEQLEILNENVVVHRLLSEVFDKNLLIAPHWEIFRGSFSQMVEKELLRRNTHQGIK